ncbi:MAG: HdeD family acid-resistance protein, partial [Eggerthella lenta]
MDTTNKHDWGLVIAGVLLVICSMFFLFAPGLALVTITVIAGAAFLVSGIFDIVNYFRFRRAMDLSGWALAYGALDIVLGILFLVNPLVSAGALAWFIGAFFI